MSILDNYVMSLRMLLIGEKENLRGSLAQYKARNEWLHRNIDAVCKSNLSLFGKWADTRSALRAANTRANKAACLALFFAGLIAIEAQALVLFFLPK